MDRSRQSSVGRRVAWGLMILVSGVGLGCAAFSNPTLTDAIPVNRLPPQALGPSREAEKTIPLTLLRQEQPKSYLLDAGDVLGVFIEGVLGERLGPADRQPAIQLHRHAAATGGRVPDSGRRRR